MTRATLGFILFIILLVLGVIVAYFGYAHTIYTLDRANALFSRAETAGFAEELISYIERGRPLLPKDGNPVWLFPTDKTDFSEIQADIDSILARAKIIQGLPRDSDGYQQGMDDLRGKIRTLQIQISDAAPYLFVSLTNIGLSALYTFTQIGIVLFLIGSKRSKAGRRRRRTQIRVETIQR